MIVCRVHGAKSIPPSERSCVLYEMVYNTVYHTVINLQDCEVRCEHRSHSKKGANSYSPFFSKMGQANLPHLHYHASLFGSSFSTTQGDKRSQKMRGGINCNVETRLMIYGYHTVPLFLNYSINSTHHFSSLPF